VFQFYVLFIFKGFNIQTDVSASGHGLFERALAYGLITSLIFYLYEFYGTKFLATDTILKRIIGYLIEIILGIQVVFLLFNYFWEWQEWSVSAYAYFLYEYPSVMIIPILISWVAHNLIKKPKPNSSDSIKFNSENHKEFISISIANFLYLKSSGNYVEVYYLSDGTVKNSLIRNSLKSIENKYQGHQNLIKCHRSYLVNPIHIKSVLRQKGKTELDLGQSIIPVSGKYEAHFKG